jgi:hypothetical protein
MKNRSKIQRYNFTRRRIQKALQTRMLEYNKEVSENLYKETLQSISFLQGNYNNELRKLELDNYIPKHIK